MSTIKALNFFSEAVLSNGREATEAEDILVITRASESNSSAFLLVGPVNSSDKPEYLTWCPIFLAIELKGKKSFHTRSF